jgi:CheY-like chemotaxis protein
MAGSPSTNASLEAQLELIWARNRAVQYERLAAVRAAVESLALGDTQQVQTGVAAAHKLAGSLGAFGLGAASRAAARIEQFLPRARTADVPRLNRLIAQVGADLDRGPRPGAAGEDLEETVAAIAATERVDLVVVDDDQVFAEAIAAWSVAFGYSTRCFLDGESALAALETLRPAAVLLDVDLPDVNGLEVLRRLQANGVAASTNVVMLTGRSTPPDVLRALQYDIRGYVSKPVNMADLFARLRAMLAHNTDLFIVGPAVPAHQHRDSGVT